MKTTAEKPSQQTLEVRVKIDQLGDETLPDAAVYVFDEADRLLASEPLAHKASRSIIKLPPGEFTSRRLRAMVAPAMPAESAITAGLPQWMPPALDKAGLLPPAALYETLKRRGGVELKVKPGTKPGIIDIEVSRADWTKWLSCSCQVRGRLVKRVKMPDGSTATWGVCHACVQIWEVDEFPYVLAKIPDDVIYRVRDDLIDLLKRPPSPPRRLAVPPSCAGRGRSAAGNLALRRRRARASIHCTER